MRHDEKRDLTAIWRTAHGLGAVALVVLAIAVFMALPVRAQLITADGLDARFETTGATFAGRAASTLRDTTTPPLAASPGRPTQLFISPKGAPE